MRAYVPALVLASFVLTACGPDYDCGTFVYSPSEERCVCPIGFIENEDFTSCISLDAGAMPDGGMPDAPTCVPRAEECNGVDDDCDGVIDGPTASAMCGSRDRATSLTCTAGECIVSACEAGFLDCDAALENGCEQATGTLAACTSCDDACGWECTETGCDDAIDIDAGRDHICLVRESGSVFCWGNNDQGQLGIGSMGAAALVPTRVQNPTATGGLTGIIDVAAGAGFTCAVGSDGSVWCWGSNASGQLGNGSTDPSVLPVLVVGLPNATRVSAGTTHACALTEVGGVWCWGRSDSGELGLVRTGAVTRAEQVPSLANVTAITTGHRFTCVLREDGQVRCFGSNFSHGELGDGSGSASSAVPVTPQGLPLAAAIASGEQHTCAVARASGELWCWGRGRDGDFDFGGARYDAYVTPERIEVGDLVTSVFAGAGGTCVIYSSGRSQCARTDLSTTPGSARLYALTDVASAVGSCAVDTSGGVECWPNEAGAVPARLSPP